MAYRDAGQIYLQEYIYIILITSKFFFQKLSAISTKYHLDGFTRLLPELVVGLNAWLLPPAVVMADLKEVPGLGTWLIALSSNTISTMPSSSPSISSTLTYITHKIRTNQYITIFIVTFLVSNKSSSVKFRFGFVKARSNHLMTRSDHAPNYHRRQDPKTLGDHMSQVPEGWMAIIRIRWIRAVSSGSIDPG